MDLNVDCITVRMLMLFNHKIQYSFSLKKSFIHNSYLEVNTTALFCFRTLDWLISTSAHC